MRRRRDALPVDRSTAHAQPLPHAQPERCGVSERDRLTGAKGAMYYWLVTRYYPRDAAKPEPTETAA